MTGEIHGTNGTLYAKASGGEFAKFGNVLNYAYGMGIAVDEINAAMYRFGRELVQASMTLDAVRWDLLRRVLVGDIQPSHGGVKMRRRKHGGRWAKLDRRQRTPPAWLVSLRS